MKQSVLTITLNPCVDKSSVVDKIVPEKKLRCATPKYEPGGGGINISRALKRLGLDSEACILSGGRTGLFLEQLLQKEQIAVMPLHVKEETRENFIVIDESNNQQYRFGMPGGKLGSDEQEAVLSFIEDRKIVDDIV